MRPPTYDECRYNARVRGILPNTEVMAAYYPQMGGYVGRCWIEPVPTTMGPCFDVYVWHDGEFPFGEGEPRVIHHCMAEQFVLFGRILGGIEAEVEEGNWHATKE